MKIKRRVRRLKTGEVSINYKNIAISLTEHPVTVFDISHEGTSSPVEIEYCNLYKVLTTESSRIWISWKGGKDENSHHNK